jgi:dynein heavy chain, axonemal
LVCWTLRACQASFKKLMDELCALRYDVLDVKASQWHDDFNRFKAGVKDLEAMLARTMQLAFDSAASLAAKAELLEARNE